MTAISINLTDDQLAELTELAQTRHKTPEETLEEIVQSALPTKPAATQYSILDIMGMVESSGLPDSRLHDQIIAEEAMNPHDDEE